MISLAFSDDDPEDRASEKFHDYVLITVIHLATTLTTLNRVVFYKPILLSPPIYDLFMQFIGD